MTRGSRSSEMEEAEIDKARLLAGLPNNRKIRNCIGCRTKFDSRGQRFCLACTFINASSGHDCLWELQNSSSITSVKRG